MRDRKLEIAVLLGIIVLTAPAFLSAQATGQFVGLVFDASGAVVPNATVTALERGTDFRRTTVTTSAGTYLLASMPVGNYQLTVSAPGFKTGNAEASLDVGQQREINFSLAVGQVTTKVQVSAAPPLLTTTHATLSHLVTGQQVVTLPLNGRDVSNLMLMEPGTAPGLNAALAHTQYPGVNWVSNNGSRANYTTSYLDGIDTSDNEMGGQQLTNFNLDAIAEFELVQNNFSAKYGRGSAMVVNLVSKSGTNQFHGDVFEFLRNTDLNARNFFSSSVPPLERNEFGGVVGGPIIRNRTFFFFEYAGLRQVSGPPINIAVPTADERQGRVSATVNGKADTLLVPLVPAAQTVLNSYPLPNNPAGAFGARTYVVNLKTPIDEDQFSIRLDHRFSDKDSLFGRYTHSNNQIPIFTAALAAINGDWSDSRHWNVRNLGITETHLFSSWMMNTLTLSWSRTIETDSPSPVTNLAAASFSDNLLSAWGPFRTGFINMPDGGVLNDNVTLQRGRHAINAGFEYRRVSASQAYPGSGYVSGMYNFRPGTLIPVAIPTASGAVLAAGSASPNSLVSLMLGIPASAFQSGPFPGFGAPGDFIHFTIKDWQLDGWLQDDVKVTPNLTLNVGLRYEYNAVPRETAGRLTAVDDSPQSNHYLRLLLNPEPLWEPDHRGFGPRFGFAYRLGKSSVIRGGFGIFTTGQRLQIVDNPASSFPMAASGTFLNPAFSVTPRSLFTPGVSLRDLQGNALPPNGDPKQVAPNTPIDLQSAQAALGSAGLIDVNVVSRGLRNGYIESANMTLERQFPKDLFVQAAYVATNAVGLYGLTWPNAYTGAQPQFTPYGTANPGLGQILMVSNSAHSTYNALQTMLRKTSDRYGLQLQTSYTFGKEIDNGSADTNGPAGNAGRVQNNPTCFSCERAVGNGDVTHRLVSNVLYNLPLARWNAAPRRLVEGWQIGGILTAQSGQPFTVLSPFGTAIYGTNTSIGNATRPFLAQNPTFNSGTAAQYFSDAVIADGRSLGQQYFATPRIGSLQTAPGNLGRNTFRSPFFWDLDFTALKETKISERFTLQLRGEFFNFFNLHAFGLPGATLGSSGFGKYTSTVFPERQIQVAAKVLF